MATVNHDSNDDGDGDDYDDYDVSLTYVSNDIICFVFQNK